MGPVETDLPLITSTPLKRLKTPITPTPLDLSVLRQSGVPNPILTDITMIFIKGDDFH